jgi:hypothetical protein
MGPIDHYDRCDVRLNNIAPPLSELLPSPNLGQLLIGTLVNDSQVSVINATGIAVQRDRLAFGEMATSKVATVATRIESKL